MHWETSLTGWQKIAVQDNYLAAFILGETGKDKFLQNPAQKGYNFDILLVLMSDSLKVTLPYEEVVCRTL
ncbi:hypothetical protein SUGI_0245590 [Cryptomeria japonica]|nr:hypothetical protein SUGI_0245590 [Cryptomeria japonica]